MAKTKKELPNLEEKKEKIDPKDTALAEAMAMIAKLKKQLDKKTEPIIIQKDTGLNVKKIKCINLMHNPINITTEPDGQGRVYSFEKYGDVRFIKFDDLSDIVSSYPNTMENVLIYIANSEFVEYHDLVENYENVYTKEIIDKIIFLREESDVDLFLGMNKHLKESTALEIARRYNENEQIDLNFLERIKKESKFDIRKIAEEIKKDMTFK